jgi:2-methylcitrate dehydratase PrpD
MSGKTVAETLGAYAARERARPPTTALAHAATRAVIDWFAATLPGSRMAPATLLLDALAGETGGAGAGIVGHGRRASVRTAALVNATASHTVEFDDIFRDGVYHPGSPTVAAALALGQREGVDGATFLKSVLVGYEVSTRLAAAIQPGHYRFWHTTGTIGTFGAAAAAAVLLELDGRAAAHALATAATLTGGLQQAFRSDAMSKPLHAGHAADAGVLAALGAARGLTGALDVLEGEAGFGAATSTTVDWSKATAELGTRYNIEAMTVKNHGCCGHSFAAIDGALALQRAHGFEAADVRAVRVATYGAALRLVGNRRMSTAYEAKFSLPYVVAHALIHGSVRLDAFDEVKRRDPELRRLVEACTVELDAEAEAGFPERRAALVEITLADGRVVSHRQPTRIGDPDAPLDDTAFGAKFRELAGPVPGAVAAEGLLARLWDLACAPDLALPQAFAAPAR